MKTRFCSSLLFITLVLASRLTLAQPFDILTFDTTSTGPWSEVGRTTLMVPKVPNGSVVLDGAASTQEYGGFDAITVEPGVNAWILDFPDDRTWEGTNDSRTGSPTTTTIFTSVCT